MPKIGKSTSSALAPTNNTAASPPIKPIDPLTAAYDKLNALWNKAEADFATMRVPIAVEHEVSRGYIGYEEPEGECVVKLHWLRHNDRWRLCWSESTKYFDVDPYDSQRFELKPIAECPMEVRVNMAWELPKLRAKMKEAQDGYFRKVLEAIALIEKTLAE